MYRLHQSQVLFWSIICFLAGVAQLPLFGAWLVAGFVIAAYRKIFNQTVSLPSIILFMLCCGVCWWAGQYRYQTYIPDTMNIPYETAVSFSGMISKPPVIGRTTQKIYIATAEYPGKVYVKTGRYPAYSYGDMVNVSCTLRQPEPFDTFAFDKYLARYGVYSICQQASLYKTSERQGYWIMHKLYDLRNWFRVEIKQLWPEPVASLLLGVILGIQDDIPDDIVAQFRATGTIHILVVSGMHVMIIAQLLSRLGLQWFSRKQLFWLVVVVLAGFCVITGLAASVVRASIMGVLPLVAQAYGRRPVMHYSLMAVAGAMVIWNPLILVHDVGFQLSFLATIGLVYFQPICDRACWWLPQRFGLRETLSTTLAATLTTSPLVLSVFGMISLVSPMANMIVVPVSTFMLFAGTGVILLNQVIPSLAKWWAYLVWQIVTWMLQFIQWLGSLSLALIDNIAVPPWLPVAAFSLIIIYIIWRVKLQSSQA